MSKRISFKNKLKDAFTIRFVLLITIFVILLYTFSTVFLDNVEKEMRQQTVNALKVARETVHNAIGIITRDQINNVILWARSPEVVDLTRKFLELPRDAESLINSEEQKEIRVFFRDKLLQYEALGIFIIAPDYINLASMRDQNIGTENLMAQQKGELLKKVFAGESQLIPPLRSDVLLFNQQGELQAELPTMFAVAPVRDENGKVIAALSVRYDPIKNFSAIQKSGHYGESGETYLFDSNGVLLSEIRYCAEMKSFGFLEQNKIAALNFRLLDPGVNLKANPERAKEVTREHLTYGVSEAVKGQRGTSLRSYRDYRGVPVLGAWEWIDDLQIGLIAEVNEEEALAVYRHTVWVTYLLTSLSLLIVLVFLWMILRTKQKSNKELKERELLYRKTFDRAPLGIARLDTQGRIDRANIAFRNLIHYEEDEIKGIDLFEHLILEEKEKEQIKETFSNFVMRKAEMPLLQTPISDRYGNEIFGHISFSLSETEDKPPVVIAILEDVTLQRTANLELEQKTKELLEVNKELERSRQAALSVLEDASIQKSKAEKAAKELSLSERKYRHLIDELTEGFFIHDIEGRFTFVNRALARIFGFEEEDELIGSNFYDFLLPGSLEQIIQISRNVTEDSKRYNAVEAGIRTRNGEIRYISGYPTPYYEGDEVKGVQGLVRDVTQEKESAQELRKLSEAVKNSPVAVIIADLGGWIEFVNPVFTRITGYSVEEAIGQRTNLLKSGYHDDEYYKELWQTLNSGRVWKGEFVNKRKDGSLYRESASIAPVIDKDGKVVNYVAIKEDITQRKELEAALVNAKEEAERANKAKSDFLANMSHEIRTPMNAIIGLSHLALQTELSARQYDYINKIDRSAQSLLGIINDILDFSKVEAGRISVEEVEFDLDDTIATISNLISQMAFGKGLEFIIDISDDVPVNLIGDSLRVSQVLTNYCSNAVKFTNTGEVILRIKLLEKTNTQCKLEFSVSDTGIGISSDQRKNLFKPFKQADSSTTRKFGGTGLGLVISKHLTELMGGETWVESTLGKGSTFYFTSSFKLPDKLINREYHPAIDLLGKEVLICDDNKVSREILSDKLKRLKFNVTETETAEEAIGLLVNEKQKIDLVMMDWKLPGMNGIEAVSTIKKELGKKSPLAILITAYGGDELTEQAIKAGCDGFISKPVCKSELFNAIMTVFGKKETILKKVNRSSKIPYEKLEKIEGAQILLVEDNEINQQVAQEILQDFGLRVITAENGKEALEQLDPEGADKIDLILMDLQMPEMDGYEATKKIRELNNYKKKPILALTADVMEDVEHKTSNAGFNGIITKPIDTLKLTNALLNWIQPKKREVGERTKKLERKDLIFPAVNGLDIEDGLKRVNNNKGLYAEIVLKMHDQFLSSETVLNELFEKREFKKFRDIVHTLKGVSGNAGAIHLFKITKSVLRKLDQDKIIDKKDFRLLKDELKSLMESIAKKRKILNSYLVTEQSLHIKKADRKLILEKLIEYLKKSDIRAKKVFSALKNSIEIFNNDPEFIKLERYIISYEFEKAETIAKGLLKKLNENEE